MRVRMVDSAQPGATLVCLVLLALTVTDVGAQNRLPPKIAAMYTGWVAPNQEDRDLQVDLVEGMLGPLTQHCFTSFYAKFQGVGDRLFDLTDPVQFARLRLVAEACAERELALVAYTYHHPHHGRNPERFPEHEQLQPLVLASGEVVEDRFALANWETWRYMSDEVFQLARAGLVLPIAAVGIDVEVVLGALTSYDDEAWADFAAECGFDVVLPAAERGPFVAAQGLSEDYREWYRRRWDTVVTRWCDEIHAINPDLSIAIMPAHLDHWLVRPFIVHAATERAPAIIDHWGMYNGSGLTDELLAVQDEVKALNPHNRFVLWFRPDSYRPSDLRVQAYHTLLKTDGYCNWHIGMLLPGGDATDQERADAAARWAAYGEANATALDDLAAGRTEPSIPFAPVKPLVAKLDLTPFEGQPIPQLVLLGDGSGEDRWIPTRELQQFLIYARAGESIAVDLRHLAGDRRPLALQYRLVAPGGATVRNEAVGPGAEESFSVDAPETGTYALYVTGGAGGQAWYAVRVHNPFFAYPLAGREGHAPQFFHIAAFDPMVYYLTRSDPAAPASVTVATGPHQAIVAQVEEGEPVTVLEEPVRFDLSASDAPIRVRLYAPETLPEGFYVQHIALRVEGAVYPYAAVSPERRLVPAGE